MINPFVRDYFKNKRIEKNFKLDTGDKIIYSVYSTSKKKFEAQVCC